MTYLDYQLISQHFGTPSSFSPSLATELLYQGTGMTLICYTFSLNWYFITSLDYQLFNQHQHFGKPAPATELLYQGMRGCCLAWLSIAVAGLGWARLVIRTNVKEDAEDDVTGHQQSCKRSIGFNNHREGPYKDLLLVESALSHLRHS